MLGLRPRTSQVWANAAADLAQWAGARLVNRADTWAQYLPPKKRTPQQPARIVKGKLRQNVLAQHFAAEEPADIIGLHAVSDEGTCRWLAIEVGPQGEDDPAKPGDRFHAALEWHDRLRDLGLRSLLIETGEHGGYVVLLLLDAPSAASHVAAFVDNLVSDYGDKGLYHRPRTYPDPALFADGSVDDWMRLPGRSPLEDHFPRVWDGDAWVGDEAAVAMLLEAPTNSDARLHQKPVHDNASPAEAALPPAADQNEQWPDDLDYVIAEIVDDEPAAPDQAQPIVAEPDAFDPGEVDPADLIPVTGDDGGPGVEVFASPAVASPAMASPVADEPAAPEAPEAHPLSVTAERGVNVTGVAIEPPPRPRKKRAEPAASCAIAAPTEPIAPITPPAPEAPATLPLEQESNPVNDFSNAAVLDAPPAAGHDAAPSNLPQPARQTLDDIAAATGLREDEIIKRIFQWVADQDEIVRAVVLGQIPHALRPNVLRLIAERAEQQHDGSLG